MLVDVGEAATGRVHDPDVHHVGRRDEAAPLAVAFLVGEAHDPPVLEAEVVVDVPAGEPGDLLGDLVLVVVGHHVHGGFQRRPAAGLAEHQRLGVLGVQVIAVDPGDVGPMLVITAYLRAVTDVVEPQQRQDRLVVEPLGARLRVVDQSLGVGLLLLGPVVGQLAISLGRCRTWRRERDGDSHHGQQQPGHAAHPGDGPATATPQAGQDDQREPGRHEGQTKPQKEQGEVRARTGPPALFWSA